MRSLGLPPVADAKSRCLVLGTLPGGQSLRSKQYYADPGNSFWNFARSAFGIAGPYDERIRGLLEVGLALWDVLREAEREGSLDSAIVKGTEVPNKFEAFFEQHPRIELVVFNGDKPAKYFQSLVAPEASRSPRALVLPSTSGTNTHMTQAAKTERWSEAVGRVLQLR